MPDKPQYIASAPVLPNKLQYIMNAPTLPIQQIKGPQYILDAPITTLQEHECILQEGEPKLKCELGLECRSHALQLCRLQTEAPASQVAPFVVPTNRTNKKDADTRSNVLLERSNRIQSGQSVLQESRAPSKARYATTTRSDPPSLRSLCPQRDGHPGTKIVKPIGTYSTPASPQRDQDKSKSVLSQDLAALKKIWQP